ncbi:class I SAM-dependent methyltransferase [Aquimarina sp. TRL1]|uniref:class I SAM-dependent methyltransferase n=1 Tax=Aquimarina sp. (strain TRL1) TaxID=2736252 RepID=UPI00158B3043|nr:class I SAM-dependent methyltransferase [Aquimarina sp. TRL1]QKX06678.1 class I SAM-dependent methyltransferase [Aquimarina sp. TRL1]
MKDNFSLQSDKYAEFRPKYPVAFFEYLDSICVHRKYAWDCGTGNGQVGYELTKIFDYVFATDISQAQLDNALKTDNIEYSLQAAEKTNFDNQVFDFIIAAQAIHWFDFDKFYSEVYRTAKKHAIFCVVGYGKIKVSPPIDTLINHFYTMIIGQYWDKERQYIDQNYATIPFPFHEIPAPEFENIQYWSLAHLIGYLNTWSAVKHFIRHNNYNPVLKLEMEIQHYWKNNEIKKVTFPILLRIGKINR